jgi:hypothetical protein
VHQRPGQVPGQQQQQQQQQQQLQQGAQVGQQRPIINTAQGPSIQGSGVPGQIAQNGQPRMSANGLQTSVMGGMGLAGVSQAQAQQILAMQQQQRLPNQASTENLRMQMQQRQLQMQQQLPGQTPSLAAAHLSPSGANMPQNQQQIMAAVLQRAALVNGSANGMAGGVSGIGAIAGVSSTSGNPGMSSQQPGQLSSGHTPTLIAYQHQIQQKYPHLSHDQVRGMANESLKSQIRQSALNAAAGGAGGMQSQNLAQQHLGLHGQAQQQQQQMMAAAFAAQNGLNGSGMPGANAPNGSSPTQMYRNVAASHQAVTRMTSGSPAGMGAGMGAGGAVQMSDSRSGTPNGMVRSLSGASGSPIMGGNGMGR